MPPFRARSAIGLSPRVRGNQYKGILDVPTSRSIPACTGEPSLISAPTITTRVYPRVYGGTSQKRWVLSMGHGLSPRVRGNLQANTLLFKSHRSIPACTGEPLWASRKQMRSAVYPRVYGGTHSRASFCLFRIGLSPRVRGNHLTSLQVHVCSRSIPACTGEPLSQCSPIARQAVYPRVYGGTCSSL